MKTTLLFPDDLLTEVKHEAVRQHRKLKDLVPELVREGLVAQRQGKAASGVAYREAADNWLNEWRTLGLRIEGKVQPTDSLVTSLEADRGSRG